MNPWAYWWLRWVPLACGLVNLAVAIALVAIGSWYLAFPNVVAAGVGLWFSLWWAPRFRARTERERAATAERSA